MTSSAGLPARRAAYKALCRVILSGKSLDELSSVFDNLTPQDTAFARALTLTVLRHFGPLEHFVRSFTDTKKKIKPKELNIIACMGAAQLKLMHVPDHAAVDTLLNLAAKEGFNRQKGFLNALMRRLTKEPQKEITIDAKTCHYPDWMLHSWQKAYGKDETQSLIKALMQEAPLDITCPNDEKRQDLINTYNDQCTPIGQHTIRFAGQHPDVRDIKGYDEGYWWVQDAASAHPVSALSLIPETSNRMADIKALDICAAPGGKTMQLASLGMHVTALDISAPRLKRLQDNIHRTKLNSRVKMVQGDALTHQGKYDIILLDAPCTATGTMRRHPDAAFVKSKEQMDELVTLQSQMLDHAYSLLNDNGYILYCTCSLQTEEGENIINQFVERNPSDITLLNINTAAPINSNQELPEKQRFFRSTPTRAPLYGDGFFAALIHKK